jgi:hypothetical protein
VPGAGDEVAPRPREEEIVMLAGAKVVFDLLLWSSVHAAQELEPVRQDDHDFST